MRLRRFGVCLLFCGVLLAAEKKKPTGPVRGGNDVLDITANVLVDKEAVIQALGMDPGLALIIVNVKVSPKGDSQVQIFRDDFTLLLSRDGQKSQPLEPGQIAGRGGIVVSTQGVAGSGGVSNGPSFGIPGIGRMGGGGVGNAASTTEAKTTVQTDTGEADNPLLKVLKEKVLPEKETNDPDSGLLYFLFDGKPPKVKDLTLIYKFHGGKVILDFKP
ncbi:MAG: hypothetical protein ABJF23_05350 [Bryobacteraceae bacterium]